MITQYSPLWCGEPASNLRWGRKLGVKIPLVGFYLGASSACAEQLRKLGSKTKNQSQRLVFYFGADYGARTRHLHLGKVALYQMS